MKQTLKLYSIAVWLGSCAGGIPVYNKAAMYTAYGCNLTMEQMLETCPVAAVGDCVIICKPGTIYVAGGPGTMNWADYMASKYSGAEGPVMECKSGKPIFKDLHVAPLLTYRDDILIVDKQLSFEIFDPETRSWIYGIELPVWRTVISASRGKLFISPDSLIFRPPPLNRLAFASADSTYRIEMNRTDHYMYMRTVDRLLGCALCGDTLSEKRLLKIEKELAGYFANNPDSKKYFNEKMAVFLAYKNYLSKGGKPGYFDLSVFPYFYTQMKKTNKNLPPPRTTKKPIKE